MTGVDCIETWSTLHLPPVVGHRKTQSSGPLFDRSQYMAGQGTYLTKQKRLFKNLSISHET